MSNNKIIINGVTYSGDSIRIQRIMIDGVDVTPDEKIITIEVQGDVVSVDVDSCKMITVGGEVGSIHSTSGDIDCGPVTGNVTSTSGGVRCNGDIGGSVETISGKVECGGKIGGRVTTVSGNIRSA